ncbi:glycoside hydrolase family 93 [Apiospora phragmitis]|uniref:Glycoside hydrolase family 93 n=1 Tax=Apiospora phragmitis TaxID=2905665 RepID=A0ABR1VFM8_9PEZI
MQICRAAVFGLLSSALSQAQALAAPPPTSAGLLAERATTTTLSDVTIFSPPSNAGWVDPRVLYARAVALNASGSNGTLLATWENYSPEPPLVHFPIYRSTDKGKSWTPVGEVQDTQNGWGMRYQPTLFELPQAVGDFPAGTVLAAGNSIPTDLSKTKIDVYASTDGGATWTFVSSVASGGEARPSNGLTPVWEPMLMVFNNQLVCYYSDQRDTKYGQKLVHQTTTDLRTWSDIVDDVRDDANYAARPGMPAVAPSPTAATSTPTSSAAPTAATSTTGSPRTPWTASCPAQSFSLQSTKGTRPTSSPYVVVWNNDTIVLSAGSGSQLFVNRQLGDPAAWVEYATPQPGAYSRGLALLGPADPDALLLVGAGGLPPSTTNRVSVSVIDLRATLAMSGGAAKDDNNSNTSNNNGGGSQAVPLSFQGQGQGQAASNGAAVSSGAVRRRSRPLWRRHH